MIVDVQNKDQHLMQMFYDVSDEVYLMMRKRPSHFCNLEAWRTYIDRPADGAHSPVVIERSDRQAVPGDLDGQGDPKRLKPLLDAARPGGLAASPIDYPFEFARARTSRQRAFGISELSDHDFDALKRSRDALAAKTGRAMGRD